MGSPGPASHPGHGRGSTTGDAELDARLDSLLDELAVTANRDQVRELLISVVGLAQGHPDRLDLKIAAAALREMREGFEVFAPYRDVRKITMFGSARTLPTDPLYAQARDLASLLASMGWSTVTGAGPGIMAAGLEGAGPEHAFGINIRLPFEQEANQFISSDPKLVSMKYFFTRKLLLVKESDGYAVLPGGYGTLDEAFELLTLLQTGKAEPSPVVLLEVPGGSYWQAWEHFVTEEVEARGLISPGDASLYLITDDVAEAAAGDPRLLPQLPLAPMDRRSPRGPLARAADPRRDGRPVRGVRPYFPPGVDRESCPARSPARSVKPTMSTCARIALRFDRTSYSHLRQLIDALNALPSAPPPPPGLPVPPRHLIRER